MASEAWTWTDFVKVNGWNYGATQQKYPTKIWVLEKVALRTKQFLDDLPGSDAKQGYEWTQQAYRTIKEIPELLDKGKILLDYRASELMQKATNHSKGDKAAWEKVTEYELAALTEAMGRLAEAKYKSLRLVDLNIKPLKDGDDPTGRVVFALADGSDPKAIAKIMEDWNNK